MCDYDNAIFRLATEAEPEDYTGEDGLLYCGKLPHSPKKPILQRETAHWFGRDRHPTECDCQRTAAGKTGSR